MDADRVRSLFDQGLKHREAAAHLGVTEYALASFCSRNSILRRPASRKGPSFAPERLRFLIEVEERTQDEAAEEFGLDRTTIERWCRRLGLRTQRTGPRGGSRHPNWKGGTKILKGYRYVHQPDHPNATKQGYVAEHRLVMEKRLGRVLRLREVVHHRNSDTLDNSPDNLELFGSNADHLRHELTGHIPNWTEEGRRAIRLGVEKAVRNRRCAASPRP